MNANRESRDYAQKHFYDVKLDVWPLTLDCNMTEEIREWEATEAGQSSLGGYDAIEVARGPDELYFFRNFLRTYLCPKLSGLVLTQLRNPPPKETEFQGSIYMSSQNDRFALSKRSWGGWRLPGHFPRFDMCVVAPIGIPMYQALADFFPGFPQSFISDYDYDNQPLVRHMTGRLPNNVVQRIRRLVYLHQERTLQTGANGHNCGVVTNWNTRLWKLGAFKGASEFSTAFMMYIPKHIDLDDLSLIEWEKTGQDRGALSFNCKCRNE
ncbi:hypothetical protein PG999_003039 [Apiospora kogelbergensis]|uniref:Uncharacterized protein n=1 Tax=Apiospora kogelbergensis TaxID=1337665 RepID=A0AAW0R9U5_9PEZI